MKVSYLKKFLAITLIFVMQFQSVHASVAIGGGWSLNLTRVENSTNIFTAFKNGFQSTVAISPSSAQVAKSLLRGGLVGLALSAVTQALLDGVDFVMDSAKQELRYHRKAKSGYGDYSYNSIDFYPTKDALCSSFMAIIKKWDDSPFNNFSDASSYQIASDTCYVYDSKGHLLNLATIGDYSEYNRLTTPILSVATQIINLAEQGNPEAKAYIASVVQDMLEHDEDYRKSLEAQLDAKLKEATQTKKPNDDCPSGEYSHLGQCWICDSKDLPIITARTQLAKNELRSLRGCKGNMTNQNDLERRINAFSELISAREAENKCWSPPDPGHVKAVEDANRGIANCKNLIEKLNKPRNRGR